MSDEGQREEGWVRRADEVVRNAGVILYPTETVYGLGCDPHAGEAIRRIERLKGRASGKPMLVLTDAWSRVAGWISGDVEEVLSLFEGLPVTFLLPASDTAPPALVGSVGDVGMRRTVDPFCRALIQAIERPITSTSANPSGAPTPTNLEEVDEHLANRVDLVVPTSRRLGGVASTILRLSEGRLSLVREGAVTEEELRKALGSQLSLPLIS